MSESTKRPHDDESEDSADDLIGPMPSEAAKPKTHKCKCLQWTVNYGHTLINILYSKFPQKHYLKCYFIGLFL